MRILLTGAKGFIGRAVGASVIAAGYDVRATSRDPDHYKSQTDREIKDWIALDVADEKTNWSHAVEGVDVVIHLAGRVHIMGREARDALAEYRRINTQATEHLARSAAARGVKRFIYLSSIKVNGEHTRRGEDGDWQRYSEKDPARPQDAYGISKWEAEQALQRIGATSKLETVILRVPLVYGPGVKANFLRLLRIVKLGIPLPLGRIRNLRSYIFVGNLCDAILICVRHPAAAGRTYLLSDDDVSTPELINRIAASLRLRARLFSVPVSLLRTAGMLTGTASIVARLLDSLLVDGSRIRRELQWSPTYSMREGLEATSTWFLQGQRS
ncbi:MAG: NAD-dependent epimerase/dehydratase family protein [Gammaproteobacteria bacterium]|nr:NAD-dependent epimerase/dehydratase family protein [Gammaproteobacteria bacterium]